MIDSVVAYLVVNQNAQYIQAGPGARTTGGRNTFRTRGFNETDVTLIKNFRFGDDNNEYNLQIGAEIDNVFNLRNRTIYSFGPDNLTTTAFANVSSSSFNNYSLGIVPGRTVQLRTKFIF